ncbi:hypothetical protein BB561_003679 [Smittium simulii]|uniref:Dipeptidyl-peptidase V n=1 Tax=Smittium simulii TaxID=133385 RepID=A0A2T9YK31_9FUNG|nr:hypothetical protein BB561_003679 [Smittium simulii]
MRFELLILSLLPAFSLGDIANPDPKIFPDWSKTNRLLPGHVAESNRIQAFAASPNSKHVAYVRYRYNITDNKITRNLKLIDLSSDTPKTSDLTEPKVGQRDNRPVWFNDDHILFEAIRGSPAYNLFSISTADNKISQITNYTSDISNIVYSKNAKQIAFVSSVYKDMTIDESTKETERIESSPSSGVVYDKLFIRHVNVYMSDLKSKLFTQPIDLIDGKIVTTGKAVNVMAKYKGDYGIEPASYNFSPDGKSIIFSAKITGIDESWKTDVGVFIVPTDGSTEPKRINSNFNGAASSPVYSPDGKHIAWLQMATPGYESDQNQIILYEIATSKQTRLMSDNIYSPNTIKFSNDSKNLYMVLPIEIDEPIYKLEIATQKLTRITDGGFVVDFKEFADDKILVSHSRATYPPNLFSVSSNGDKKAKQLTSDNDEMIKSVWASPVETFWFKGALDEQVQGLVLYPYGFDPKKKYPVFFLIHGGPQASYYDQWGVGTNYNYYTNQGYIVLMINYHGSSTYGQKFTDSIQHNWGTHPYYDLMEGLDHFLKHAKYADEKNLVALGGSYGGYMMNWINGHTDRFNALCNYVGLFDLVSMLYSTEELWFSEHDLGIPWIKADREVIEKNNPERFVANWKTPTLVVHGALDYRVPIEQGISTFTALQRRGIDSKFLFYPDEGHGASKPPNVLQLQDEVFKWFGKYSNTTVKK